MDLKLDGSDVGKQWGQLRQLTASFRIALPGSVQKQRYVFCECFCGKVLRIRLRDLTHRGQDHCRSCENARFAKRDQSGELNSQYKHGLTGDPTHQTYVWMLQRCGYAGAGRDLYLKIKVCDRWLESFESFLADMGPKPSPNHSIDREDPEGDYEPDNCRWLLLIDNQKRNRGNRRHDEWC